jgi:hypothetical protein
MVICNKIKECHEVNGRQSAGRCSHSVPHEYNQWDDCGGFCRAKNLKHPLEKVEASCIDIFTHLMQKAIDKKVPK